MIEKRRMKTKTKWTISLLIAGFSLMLLFYFVIFSKSDSNIFLSLNPRNKSAFDVAFEFAIALRNNDFSVYEIADQNLWPQIDRWMETHQNRICTREIDEASVGSMGSDGKIDLNIHCNLGNGSLYTFEVLGIELQKQNNEFYVTNWEEIIER